jgi:hypothetical protein
MLRQPQLPERTSETTIQKPILLVFVCSFCVSLIFVLKAPDFWAILIPELTRLLQYADVNTHWQAVLPLRYVGELFQNLVAQMLAKAESAFLGIAPRPLPLGIRIRSMLMLAACDISVIIPALNEEKCLSRCLNSLVCQSTKEPVEIIVVDGGSTDRTIQVAKEYAHKVMVEPARPVGAARNIGAKWAEGKVLAFIDADTIACEEWLEEIARTFDSKPEAVGVTGPTLPYEGTRLDRIAYHVATGWVQRFSLRLGRPHVAGFNCAYRRKAFWDAGGFDEDRVLLEDVMLSLRMRHQGPILFNPEMIAYTSLRRIKKYGYPYLTTYNLINWIVMLLFNRTLAYPQVR